MEFKVDNHNNDFQPVDIQIKLETNDELLELLARLFVDENTIIKYVNLMNKVKEFKYTNKFHFLFSELNRIAAERELKER